MKKAYNQNGKLTDIIESTESGTYTCPICHEELTRNFGAIKQYFSHPKGLGDDCEYKMKLVVKEEAVELTEDDLDILQEEFYEKAFDEVEIEMSDYKSEEGYNLTEEQKEIIFSKEDRIKVAALAGAAKSSTLYYYSKERPFKRILYVVYNKAMKDEAMKSFGRLGNVDIKTMHGLAYGYVGKYYRNKLTFNYGVVDIINDLKLNWNRDMELAVKINAMMKEYMLSSAQEFKDLEMFEEDKMRKQILSCSQTLWEMKKNTQNDIKVEHDFYLKLFQLSKTDLSRKYDIILLDESQDSSKMMFDIILNSNVKGVVIVGDQYQQLYAWRNAVNIMPMFDAKEYKLTTSFRVSQNIAHIANLIISDFGEADIGMKGFNTKQKIVDHIDKSKPYACLCRTNSYIFSEIAEALSRDKNKKMFFEGGYQSYNFMNLVDAYRFSQGMETNNPILSKFKDYDTMCEYAEETVDLELLALKRMVEKYGSRILDIVNGIKNHSVTNKADADILFSTIHRSKGQTYNMPVYISNDHFDMGEAYGKKYNLIKNFFDEMFGEGVNGAEKEEKNIYEEMCIVYVAITRCAGEIELSDGIKQYLLLRYDDMEHNLHNPNEKKSIMI